jgi:aspartate/methionine/tyrosine aminotransferase
VWVLADEIYERIVYDTEHYSFANIPGNRCYSYCRLDYSYIAMPTVFSQ